MKIEEHIDENSPRLPTKKKPYFLTKFKYSVKMQRIIVKIS